MEPNVARADPYRDSIDHLLDELRRLDLLLGIYLAEWRKRNEGEITELYGLYVPDETIDTLLGETSDGKNRRFVDVDSLETELERIEEASDEIRARTQRTHEAGATLRLIELADRFGLNRDHLLILLLGLAPELDRKYGTIYSYLQDDVMETRPTVEFVLGMLRATTTDQLRARTLIADRSPLRRNRLVHLSGREGTPFLSRYVTVDDRIVGFLLDDDELADDLAGRATASAPDRRVTDLPLDETVRDTLETLHSRMHDRRSVPLMVHLHGSYGSGATDAPETLCTGEALLTIDAGAIENDELSEIIGSAIREARLREADLHVKNLRSLSKTEADPTDANRTDRELLDELDGFDGHVFLSGEEPLSAPLQVRVERHEFATVRFPRPSYELRRTIWDGLPSIPDDLDVEELAATFRLTGGQIADALSMAEIIATGDEPTAESLYEGCRIQSRGGLDSLAKRIDPVYTWDDIVLPEEAATHLREVAVHVKHRGRVYSEWGFEEKFSLGNGLAVLFTGPSGTGKTMAAEIIANDTGLDLYKIDLSSVVSKYIGETEKNLGRIFDEARRTNALLLFDEADAVFGTRSEVTDSRDRYANIEVNYLLQRIEEHDGCVILTTNFKQNIDDAFIRRIHRSVTFPRPGRRLREAIWRGVYPEATPTGTLDFEYLSTFDLTGGNIKNAALTAAFLAADGSAQVEMEHLVRAIRRELQKTGQLVTPEEFGPYRASMDE